MASRIRQMTQRAVDLIRAAARDLGGRAVADLAILNRAPALHEAALALHDMGIAPDLVRFGAVVAEVRVGIVRQGTADVSSDPAKTSLSLTTSEPMKRRQIKCCEIGTF